MVGDHVSVDFATTPAALHRQLALRGLALELAEAGWAEPSLSVGRNNTGSGLHSHAEAWLLQLVGHTKLASAYLLFTTVRFEASFSAAVL